MHKKTQLFAKAATLTIIGASLIGCQSGNRQADPFGSGSDRPPTPRTLHMMAKLINENGRIDQAEYVLMRIIDESPTYLPAYVELADMYIEQSRFTDALDTLRQARVISPTDAVLANNLGVLLLREGNFIEASQAFHDAVNQDTDEARYHANLAVSLAMGGQFNEAFVAWSMVLPPEEIFWNLAIVAEAQGKADVATQYFADANRAREGAPFPGSGTENQTATVAVPVD